jgi:hypothetical protein
MALFSGGRFIRKSLQAAGPDFWMRPIHRRIDNNNLAELVSIRRRSRSDPIAHGIQFLDFDGKEDGEDIKLEFKKRIAEAEILLTDEEKWDIVQESQHIFKHRKCRWALLSCRSVSRSDMRRWDSARACVTCLKNPI